MKELRVSECTRRGEVKVDARGRVTAIGAIVPGKQYRILKDQDGMICLQPVVLFPERDLVVSQNATLVAQIFEGLAEAEQRNTIDRGSLAAYFNEE